MREAVEIYARPIFIILYRKNNKAICGPEIAFGTFRLSLKPSHLVCLKSCSAKGGEQRNVLFLSPAASPCCIRPSATFRGLLVFTFTSFPKASNLQEMARIRN